MPVSSLNNNMKIFFSYKEKKHIHLHSTSTVAMDDYDQFNALT